MTTLITSNRQPPPFQEWWEVENTGWSDGINWFPTGGTRTNPYRANSAEEAIRYINQTRWGGWSVKWRYVHVTLERKDNKSIEIREWTIVD